MWKFSKLKDDTEQHSLSYRYLWQVAFCVPVPHIYPSVGYCIVYFSLGLSTTFYLINESQLHTFFVYILITSWGWDENFRAMPSYDQLKSSEWNNNATLRDFVEQLRQLKERDPEYSKEGIIDSLVSKIVDKESIHAAERGVFKINFDDIDFTTYVYVYWMILYEFFDGKEILSPKEIKNIEHILREHCNVQ